MKTICLYFQVHQPFRLRKYRFFDIGNDHYYYDDFANKSIVRKISKKCYLPANQILLSLLKKYKGKFKVTFSITGIVLEQFERYAPEVIDSFKELAQTGNVEFLAETYSHSLASLYQSDDFETQVKNHIKKIQEYFGQTPKVFRNTELVYSDEIGAKIFNMGFTGMITEGAKHILGWKSPNYLYYNAINPKLKLLLRNYKLSDDIGFRFSNRSWSQWPLTADKLINWLSEIPEDEEIVNLFLDYETFGEHQDENSGIFDFLKAFPVQVINSKNFTFGIPSKIIQNHQPVASFKVQYPISWADEERDLTAWLGNEMQKEAFNKLYSLSNKIKIIKNPEILKDWNYLQASDHLYYMCTKLFSDGDVHRYFNPFNSPYESFINFMNILSDFTIRVNDEAGMMKEIKANENDDYTELIKKYELKIKELKSQVKMEKTKTTKKPKSKE